MTPLQFGVIDGIYQGASALVRLAGGFAADRSAPPQGGRGGRLRAVGASAGSACCSSARLVGADRRVVFADRIGKGIRTAPRDALISLSTPHGGRSGRAFGVHRAMDTAGAMIGPLHGVRPACCVAPQRYDAIFVVSFCFAIVGLAVLLLFVREPPRRGARRRRRAGRARARDRGLLRVPALPRLTSSRARSRWRRSATASSTSACRTARLRPRYLPLLYVGTAAVYMVLAVPVGPARRPGRPRPRLRRRLRAVARRLRSLLLPALGARPGARRRCSFRRPSTRPPTAS